MEYWLANNLSQFAGDRTWKEQCARELYSTWLHDPKTIVNITSGLVDQAGILTTDPTKVWGINMTTCHQYCSYDKLGTVFDFSTFCAGATNYLLPWLALTAQLPFETGEYEVVPNIMSFCYALGSPMLITYSLMITILNQHWLRAKFRPLESPGRQAASTIKDVRIFLQESQQLPLRLSQEGGALASLIMLTNNADWWQKLRENIQITRRGVTLSLVAQIIVAIVSWAFTVWSAFLSALGNPSEALVMSSGSLWVWLVPVIGGWIAVGTQRDHGTIVRALNRDVASLVDTSSTLLRDADTLQQTDSRTGQDTVSNGSLEGPRTQMFPPADDDTGSLQNHSTTSTLRRPSHEVEFPVLVSERQKAFKVARDRKLLPSLMSDTGEARAFQVERHAETIPNCLGLSVAGDEKQEGPAFNYARIFTWWNMASRLHQAFETAVVNMERRHGLDEKPIPKDVKFKQRNLKGDILLLARYCGLAHTVEVEVEADGKQSWIVPEDLHEYPRWGELDAAFYKRIAVAITMGLFVQWGTTGAAFIISYLTEVRGLGCRSGGYMLYGSLGVASFALLFTSSLFSHAAMLRHEEIGRRRRRNGEEALGSGDSLLSSTKTVTSRPLSPSLTALRVLAVVTRALGRILVVANAMWLVLSSVWELVGFYNNCWCDGVFLNHGWSGWVILFQESSAMATAARQSWSGGVFLSAFVLAGSYCVFWLYCRGNRA